MKILKNEKAINKSLIDKTSLIYKDEFITIGLSEGKSISDIAKEKGISRQALHLRFISLCDEVERIEPRIKKLYENFDTYLNLNKIIDKFWIGFIAKLIILKKDNVFLSTVRKYHLVDKKLKHRKVYVKKGDYEAIISEFLKPIKKDIPITIKNFAIILDVNPSKLEEFLEDLFSDKIYIMSDYILSTQKGSFFQAIRFYCNNEDINYDGSLEELYSMFNLKYNFVFRGFNIFSYYDFTEYVREQIELFSGCVDRRADTREYEIRKYLLKENIECVNIKRK